MTSPTSLDNRDSLLRLKATVLYYSRWAALMVMAALFNPDVVAQPSDFPSKPIRIIVGTSPSGGTDLTARLFGHQLSSLFGQPVVIDNRPGASGLIGMELVARANPDGYTLLVLSVGHLMSASLASNPAFDVTKDFTPISLLASTPMLLVVHPSVPAKTLTDFIKLARSAPGKINYASGGRGGVQHLATALFEREAKVKLVHVPYKGSGPGVVDLLAGNVQMTMTGIAPVLAFVNSGRLRGLAVTGAQRTPVLPNVPTFAESGLPGVVIDGWHGMLAPAKTPEPIVRKLALAVAQIARMPDIRAKLSGEGAVPVGNTSSQFAAFFSSEQQRWTKLARDALILNN